VKTFADLVYYYEAHGDCHVVPKYVTAEDHFLGNWVHDQRNKYKAGTLTAERMDMLATIHFEFTMQPNVVGAKLTVAVVISQICKYQKEHGTIEVPMKDPYKQLHRWIVHAKTEAKKTIK
jgi:hypothetical protein